jgi:hypothetical protein
MNQLLRAERAHAAALRLLATTLADLAEGKTTIGEQSETLADLLGEIDGNGDIDNATLDRLTGGR